MIQLPQTLRDCFLPQAKKRGPSLGQASIPGPTSSSQGSCSAQSHSSQGLWLGNGGSETIVGMSTRGLTKSNLGALGLELDLCIIYQNSLERLGVGRH